MNFHPDVALKRRQRLGTRQAWGASLSPPATPATGSKTPQRHDHLGLQVASLTPGSGDLHFRVVSKGRASSWAPSDTCPQKPSPELWASRHSPRRQSCRCHAAVCDRSCQTSPPTPLQRYHTSGPLQTKHSFSNLYDTQCQTPL